MFGLGKPKVLEEIKSKYSGTLKVMSGFGYKYVTSGVLTQSGGLIKDVWEPVLKKFKGPNFRHSDWLILGLATGTVAQEISKNLHPQRIVGVEIDPEMIRVGKQYFSLDSIPNLKIVTNSAETVLFQSNFGKFDFILVDMYQNDSLPEFVYEQRFLDQLKKVGKTVVINHLFYEEWMKNKAEKLVTDCQRIWENVELQRVLTNLMIICR